MDHTSIALVPFVQTTAGMDEASKALVVRKMLRTVGVSAVLLVVVGELLARLLHFSTGSVSIAGGIILVIIAVTMVLGSGDSDHGAACLLWCSACSPRCLPSTSSCSDGPNRLGEHLDESRMLVTEKIFGFLLAALAVQLMLDGLRSAGVIHLSGH